MRSLRIGLPEAIRRHTMESHVVRKRGRFSLSVFSCACRANFLVAVLLFAGGSHGWDTEGFTRIFNGENLSGWNVNCVDKDRDKVHWFSVTDSMIEIKTEKEHRYMWLTYTAEEFTDFHFKCRFQAYEDLRGNSGIQFRSRYDTITSGGWMNGPQADIHPRGPWRTGSLYDETENDRGWLAGGDRSSSPEGLEFFYSTDTPAWNEYEIIASGTRVKTVLNGMVIQDVDLPSLNNQNHQEKNVGMRGHFSLQVHSGSAVHISFKDVFVRSLSTATGPDTRQETSLTLDTKCASMPGPAFSVLGKRLPEKSILLPGALEIHRPTRGLKTIVVR